ncbi:MAG: Crp/Fnr family transcriptional regulator [Paludibacteraceae bacterium]|nr:Crp/Fnr family transcriptional regulator [Paludibacteraceae bacterium]
MDAEILNRFRAFLSNISPMNDAEWEYLLPNIEVLELEKDQIFHQAGEYSKYLYFILEGTVRKFTQQKADQITNNIYRNQRFVTDLLSAVEQKPSIYSFECLSDAILIKISIAFIDKAFSMLPTYNTIGRVMYQQAFLQESKRLREVLTASPTEHMWYL